MRTDRHLYRKVIIALMSVIALVLTGWALKATGVISAPLAFAFFLAMLMHPVQQAVARHLPRRAWWIGTICAMALIVLVMALFFGAGWLAWETVDNKAAEYSQRFRDLMERAGQWFARYGMELDEGLGQADETRARLFAWARAGLSAIGGLLMFLTLVFFLTLLMLLEAGEWRTKVEQALNHDHNSAVLEATRDVASAVRRYLLIRTVVSLVSGVCGGLWLWLLNIDFALLWGFVIFLLNFIPNLGSVISSILPAAVALLQPEGSLWQAAAAFAGLTAIEQVIGNFLDPRLQGRTLQISPLSILVALLFWSWMWGLVGALLAVPLTATLVTVLEHVQPLKPLARLLSRPAGEG